MAFTHLHLHTEYSLLDGACRIKDVVSAAKELGMDSLAMTDHGVMFGAIDFYKECLDKGIKPIIGCEVYVAPRTRFDKDGDLDKNPGHLLLLAENNEGYRNLVKLVSHGFTEGFYRKPRVDRELLREHSRGIIATSACLAGFVQQHLLRNDYEGAKEEALAMEEIFGKGNYFLELQNQYLDSQAYVLPGMMRLHEETGIPFVATNDVHYIRKEDADAHDVLLCIQTGKTLMDEDRLRFPNSEFYLKSEAQMRELFVNTPEAVDNTALIAGRCNVSFDFNNYHIPNFEAPDGMDNAAYLRKLCEEGLLARYGEPSTEIRERLDYELSVIEQMGYVEYFLIVWDFINYAKNKGIVVGPGRGSAAGSLVAYCLRITNIDPIKYTLLFERFLNPERVSMPDIDIDFCYERRGEVIDYVIEKYGTDRVCQIITFGTMKAKAAIRDVGRVLGVSYSDTDKIAKAIPGELGITIDKALLMNPELKKAYDEDPVVRQVLDVSRTIEGMPRNTSTHAAGVVISKEPIEEYVPLYVGDKGVTTQYTMTTIEELGLLKMDFLGLRNLTIIRDALAMIRKNHGVAIDFENMEYDDPAVFAMIAGGNTQGVFQLESSGMTQFMKNLKPDTFEDIVAGISLYRPGPMASIPTYIENKKNPDKIRYLHESLEPILSVTYGCMVYQEQVMQIVRQLAGYTYGHSDILRRAMSKKKMDVMLSEKEVFLAGAEKNGVPRQAGEEIFNQMISFAEYAFNKSHAAAYAVVAYETAYLKCHYPREYMAALMTSVMGDAASIAKYIRNCQDMGIEVLPPDVNESGKTFTVTQDGKIRFGLLAIKNLGGGAIESIIKARENGGPFTEFTEFMQRIDPQAVNKKALESMIRAGSFDTLDPNRARLLAGFEGLLESAQNDARTKLSGQMSLFQINEEAMEATVQHQLPDVANFDSRTLAAMEKEMLGVYLTDHPLREYRDLLSRITTADGEILSREEPAGLADGDEVTVGGIVAAVKPLITRNNKQMAFLTLEDYYGAIEVIVFPNIFERTGQLLMDDAIVVVQGKLSFKEDEAPQILADNILPIEEAESLADALPARPAPQPGPDRYDRAPTTEGIYAGEMAQAPLTEQDAGPAPVPGPVAEPVPEPVPESGPGFVPASVPTSHIYLKIRVPEEEEGLTEQLLDALRQYPGEDRVVVYLPGGKMVKASFGVRVCSGLRQLIADLVGRDNIKVETR